MFPVRRSLGPVFLVLFEPSARFGLLATLFLKGGGGLYAAQWYTCTIVVRHLYDPARWFLLKTTCISIIFIDNYANILQNQYGQHYPAMHGNYLPSLHEDFQAYSRAAERDNQTE